MTAPLFLLDPATLQGLQPGSQVVLDGAEGRHAATVRRVAVGELVQLADGIGGLVTGVVTQVGPAQLVIAVQQSIQLPAPVPRIVLVQALAKGGRDEQAIEAATELGVDAVVPWQASRSIVQWRGDKQQRGLAKWQSTVRAAAKQSRRATVPVVEPLVVGRSVADRLAGHCAIVLHEDADAPLAELDLEEADEIVLVVGPEGGITEEELHACRDVGAHPVRLGPHVLRSSTAGPAAIAALSAQLRW